MEMFVCNRVLLDPGEEAFAGPIQHNQTPKTRLCLSVPARVKQSLRFASKTLIEHSVRMRPMPASRNLSQRVLFLCSSMHFRANASESLATRNGLPSCQPSCDASIDGAASGAPRAAASWTL